MKLKFIKVTTAVCHLDIPEGDKLNNDERNKLVDKARKEVAVLPEVWQQEHTQVYLANS